MKHIVWIAVMALVLGACSKEEQPAPAAQEAVAVEEAPAAEVATQAAPEEAADEEIELVEESDAVEDSEDEPILLAVADTNEALNREWKFKEGQHYTRLVPAQTTFGGADKIEVSEAFMYSCPHCRTLDPFLNRWEADKDPGIRFVRIPAPWNQAGILHAQIYYTQSILGENGTLEDPDAFHMAVFSEFHDRGNQLLSKDAVERLFARFGVSSEDFNRTWSSFEVNTRMRKGGDLIRRYGITSVPTVVVNGKYRTSAAQAGGYDELIELIEELTVREGIR